MTTPQTLLRQLPSMNDLLAQAQPLIAQYSRELTTESLRTAVADTRQAILAHEQTAPPTAELILQQAAAWLAHLVAPTLLPVINATGIIVHTNLGRAPLSAATRAAITAVAQDYNTLEYDLSAGQRGSRALHAERLLQRVTGAEAALVVNNNAAAVILMLSTLCAGQEVIISRGQLVEIGGGFRVPDIMAQSGAKLVEVGTTNRTHLRDYAQAITPHTAAILVAHPSNYKIIGFTSEPSLSELAELAHQQGVYLLYDQGSGALRDTAVYGLAPEPLVQDGLSAGCDVVTFSGDKLLGGPQAGLLCGRAEVIQRLKKAPLARALRADKLCLAGLAATLTHFVQNEAEEMVPVWQMMSQSVKALENRALAWAEALRQVGLDTAVQDGHSAVGGGSLPGTTLPTKLLVIRHPKPAALEQRLRQQTPPIIARIQDNQLQLDPRTVLPHQEATLLHGLTQLAMSNEQ